MSQVVQSRGSGFVDVKRGWGRGRGRRFGVMRGFGHVAVFTYYIEKSFNEAEIHISIFDLYNAPYRHTMHIFPCRNILIYNLY